MILPFANRLSKINDTRRIVRVCDRRGANDGGSAAVVCNTFDLNSESEFNTLKP